MRRQRLCGYCDCEHQGGSRTVTSLCVVRPVTISLILVHIKAAILKYYRVKRSSHVLTPDPLWYLGKEALLGTQIIKSGLRW